MDLVSIEQKLEQIEKIIQICLQSLPVPSSHLPSNSPGHIAPVLKLFAKQLVALKECNKSQHSHLFNSFPSLKKWLQFLNISDSSLNAIISSNLTFHDLFEKTYFNELSTLLKENNIDLDDNELNSIYNGFQNLKPIYSDLLQINANSANNSSQSINPNQTSLATNPSSNSSSSSSFASNINGTSQSKEAQQSSQQPQPPPPLIINTKPKISEPHINTGNLRAKQQRKSESDVQFNGVNISKTNPNLISISPNLTNNSKNTSSSSKNVSINLSLTSTASCNSTSSSSTSSNSGTCSSSSTSTSSSASSSSSSSNTICNNLTSNGQKTNPFSPNLPAKSKKPGGQKVSTPPPSRKLSTGNPANLKNLNVAFAIAAAAMAAAKNNQTPTSNPNNLITDPRSSPSNIQRSSSHESHLRNKINQDQQQTNLNQVNNQQSPPQLLSTTSMICGTSNRTSNSNSINDFNEHQNTQMNFLDSSAFLSLNNKNSYESVRRLSSEAAGSEVSSRCPSGQASPNLQSPTRSTFGNKSNNFLTEADINNNSKIPKSPKLTKEHRWTNTLKVSNCGYCNKKMIFGIKCKNCKFAKYVRIKNIKKCEICHKPLWHGIKCKNCKFRCHKDCEKKCNPICNYNPISTYNYFPIINLEDSQQQSNVIQSQYSNSSSAASSTSQSPALNNLTSTYNSSNIFNTSNNSTPNNTFNDTTTNTSTSTSSGWTSGVVRYANKIVNTINNTVSTPKLGNKQILNSVNNQDSKVICEQHNQQQQNLPNLKNNITNTSLESKSSSSCNSSEPNSPNYVKLYQHSNQLNPNDKKPSYSSISTASFGFFPQQFSQTQQSSVTSTLTPAQTVQSINNSSLSPLPYSHSRTPSNSNSKTNEFFSSSTTPKSNSKLDLNNNNNNNNTLNEPESNVTYLDDNNKTINSQNDSARTLSNNNQEARNNLTLDFSKDTSNLNQMSNEDFNNLVDDYSNELDKNEFSSSQQPSDLQQFNISYEEITDKVEIGRGKFGVVYRAYWHGQIAIKEIDFDEDLTENSEELKNFKEEVLNLRKTRHSNLILFIGACIKPPKCAIVMSLCRGISLHKYLHTESTSSYTKVNLDWTIDICTQIAQAIGYLHNKQMIHKDLRSKNVFIDGCKAVITDFGLYSIRRLCNRTKRDDLIPITKECLYYMAPEIVKLIGTDQIESAYSQASDVFAFGTIWYEMFCHEYPFSSYSTDSVLYLIGNGLKNLSPNIQMPKEFKIILLKCWSKDPSSRPDFSRLLETFRAIPKKTKLFRSPSHPVQINMR